MDETNPLESTDLEAGVTEPSAVETENTDPAPTDETVPETTQETEPEAATEDPGAAPVETTEDRVVIPYTGPDGEDSTEATIYADLSGSDIAATEEVTVIEVIETVGSDIAHANLFSGFLVCGTIVGVTLWSKIYGT